MTNIIKNRYFLGLLASTLVSMALLSTAYAAELTINTQNASSISPTSAVLNSIVNVTSSAANVWFEYGTNNDSLINSTPTQIVGLNFTPQNFGHLLTSLSPNTTYYFRAVAQSASSSSESILRGEVMSFSTSASQNNDSDDDPGSTGSSCDAQTEINLITDMASSVSANSALLSGVVNTTICSADVWFEYGENGSLSNSTPKTRAGLNYTTTNFNHPISNLNPNASYSFRAVAQNTSAGSSVLHGNTLNFTTSSYQANNSNSDPTSNSSMAPEVKTNPAFSMDGNSAMLDSYIKSNGSNTVAWFEYGTTDGLGNKTEERYVSVTDYQTDFQHKATGLMPNTFYYFRAAARNDYGTTYGNNYVFRTNDLSNGITFGQPTASTTSAILVRETSALLNGNIIPHNAETTIWFEWSENPEMTIRLNRNASQSIGAGDSEVYAAYSLSDLVLNKTYYFRIVAQNAYGTSRGEVKRFTTVKTVAPAPIQIPINPAPTNYVQPKNLDKFLTIEAEFDDTNPRAGSKVVYGLNYKNNTNLVLKDAILKITLPNEVNYMASSFASVGQDGNVLTFKLGDITSKKSGIVSVKMRITDLARAQNLKFNAEISYSNNGKIGKETLVNDLQISDYSLTASVLETLGSIFTNLFVDFILGTIIGAGAYHFIKKQKQVVDTEDPLK